LYDFSKAANGIWGIIFLCGKCHDFNSTFKLLHTFRSHVKSSGALCENVYFLPAASK
jgi:hypothetical protein